MSNRMGHNVLRWTVAGVAAVQLAACISNAKDSNSSQSADPLASAGATPPEALGSFVAPPEQVFDTKDACEQSDVPDMSAHAFRDMGGTVHLIASHYVARAMVGPTLSDLKHVCSVLYRASKDPDPSHFQYDNWLYSFFTEDGRRIAALVHSEFHGWEIPGLCETPSKNANCWWNTITFAQSNDGGESFTEPTPPSNLVASLPYRYEPANQMGAHGYYQPTNILKVGMFYYAMINDWPYKEQKYGPCLIRTQNPFDPQSWRAWDGQAFAVRFVDPYSEANSDSAKHVCEPVLAGVAESLVKIQGSDTYLVSVLTSDNRFGPAGLYLIASHNLTKWSRPTLVATNEQLLSADKSGHWTYGYSSLLDPESNDRNFSTVTETPYVYYVRFDQDHPPYARTLLRRRIHLSEAR
jgi:hypothetical protein